MRLADRQSRVGVEPLGGPTVWLRISMNGWLKAIRPSMRLTSGFAVPKTCRPCLRRGRLAGRLARAGRWAAGRLPGDEGIDHAGDRAAGSGRPRRARVVAGPSRRQRLLWRCCAPGSGEIGDRDAGPIDQRHGQADGQGGQALRHPALRRPQNDEEKKETEDRFGAEAGQQGLAGRGMLAVAVGGEAAGDEPGPSGGDEIARPGAQNAPDHLGGQVAGHLVGGESLADHEAHRHGEVDMTAGDMANRVHDGD